MSKDALDKFYLKQEEPNKSCFLVLRDYILDYNKGITETLKYGMPCFVYKGKQFCYLWKDKKTKEPYILIVEGGKLGHHALVKGDRARMKILPINPLGDLPLNTIKEVFDEAIKLYK